MRTIGSKKLAVEVEGSGEPVILIHGLGGTTNVWGPQLYALTPKFKVIRYDLEGSGRSPAASALSIESWVDDLDALMCAEAIAKARLVAHSLGTLIAQHFAARHPDRVDRLVLLGVNRAPTDERRQALRERAAKVRAGGLEAIVDSVMAGGLSPHARKNPPVEAFARELVLRQSPEGYARSCEAVAAAQAADISRISCPVLLLAGEDDTVSPVTVSQSFAQSLPDAQVIVLRECGHWLPIERPVEVAERLVAFL
jgi:pimeloyl-ACP methyl ester carboxylesterase